MMTSRNRKGQEGHRAAIASLLAVLALGLGGCAQHTASPRVYTFDQAQRAQTVVLGTVVSVRSITIQAAGTTGVGALAGGALGGVTGNAIGGGSGRRITTVGGAIGGAMIGDAIERSAARRPGLEITVRLDSGETRVIAQEADLPISAGQRVQIVTQGRISRVIGI